MEYLCKIIGVKLVGDKIKLEIIPNMVKDKEFNAMDAVKNIGGFIDNMKSQAVEAKNPDCVSITIDEYKRHYYKLGDMINIRITGV